MGVQQEESLSTGDLGSLDPKQGIDNPSLELETRVVPSPDEDLNQSSSSRLSSSHSVKTASLEEIDLSGKIETTEDVRDAPVATDKTWHPPLLSLKSSGGNEKNGGSERSRGSVMKYLHAGWGEMKKLTTCRRDAKVLVRYITLLVRMRKARAVNLSVPAAFDKTVCKHPNKIAFYFQDEEWTFKQVQDYSCRVAQTFQDKVTSGDTVALLMENRIEFICTWLGLSRLGVVTALLNTNLRTKSLQHCISSADSRIIIVGQELQEALSDIRSDIESVPVYVSGAGTDDSKVTLSGSHNLDTLISQNSTDIPSSQSKLNFKDKLVYIYTSGTTGLPKAAVITHSRFLFASVGMKTVVGIGAKDVLYDPLPLYHTAGGIIGVGMALVDGVTVATRKKFSVSAYFLDCIKYKCTASQYIGEICRYLLNSPPTPNDKAHSVKVMFGNGLRPQIWEQFQQRFNIDRISEFYGATEGNANIINMDGKVGAVGFLSVLLPSVYPCALIRIDTDSGKPIRDKKGLCVRCKPGEPGEFVGKIIRNDPIREFSGYVDKKATNKKIISDVFSKGDSFFLSGDILVMDEDGYLYFKDRTGDTFRWKGENVSTAEVENHLFALVNSTDLCVYGVEIPNTEGRAGMASVLDPEGKLELQSVAKGVISALPSYARPMFLRTVKSMDMTGTYKLKKVDLQKEAFDINKVSDPVYVLDAKAVDYKRLDGEMYRKVMSGEIRL